MHRWIITIKKTRKKYFKEVYKDGKSITYTKGVDDFFKSAISPSFISHKMIFIDGAE